MTVLQHAVHECEFGQVYRHPYAGIVVMAIRHRGGTQWDGIILLREPSAFYKYEVGKVTSGFDGTGWEGPLDDGR